LKAASLIAVALLSRFSAGCAMACSLKIVVTRRCPRQQARPELAGLITSSARASNGDGLCASAASFARRFAAASG
jgi:hypothetical protein